MPGLSEKVHEFLSQHLPHSSRIGIGVSGGADSVALLDAVAAQWKPVVLHFDHAMRPGSENDRIFVDELAKDRELDVYHERSQKEIRGEENARKARYDFFERSAEKFSLAAILTAHTADDQAETILFRFLRGTGLRGLAGIPPARGIYLRPLLSVRRDDVMRYIAARNLEYREDPSNSSLVFARNRMRHQILPFLKEHANPQLIEAVLRTSEILRGENDFLDGLARHELDTAVMVDSRIVLERDRLEKMHPALRGRVIHEALVRLGAPVTFETVDLVQDVAVTGGRADLSGSFSVETEGRTMVIGNRPPNVISFLETFELAMNGTTEILPMGISVSVRSEPARPVRLWRGGDSTARLSVCFDADSIEEPLILRTRRDGDRMQPFGMTGTKKLHDIFIDEKVPLRDRDRWPIICDTRGVVWVAGLRQDERTRVTEKTRRLLCLELKRDVGTPETEDAA